MKTEAPVPGMVFMKVVMAGPQFATLKDDSCSTNELFRAFMERHRHFLPIRKGYFLVRYSDKKIVEESHEIVTNMEVEIRNVK